jgi:MOSC domain-containing protein YiiM
MRRVAKAEAIAGEGLREDRYLLGTGYYSQLGGCCQVTLIAAEALERMREHFGVQVFEGQHRRNLVIRGLVLEELKDRRIRIGTALFAYAGPRPPCGYLERITEKGMTKAMGQGAGICATVLESGVIREGDMIDVYPLDPQQRRRWLP